VKKIIAGVFVFAVLFSAGCMDGAKAKYDDINNNETVKAGKKVWNVINFGLNVTNPLYYAEKGASYAYDKYKDGKKDKEQ